MDVDFRCSYGNCKTELLQDAKECYCCREIDNCVEFIGNFCCDSDEQNKEASLKCVIDHPGFPAICLNQWSLELAAENFKMRDGHCYSQCGEKQK